MGIISDGASDIANIMRQKRLDQVNADYRTSQQAKLDEQTNLLQAKQQRSDMLTQRMDDADAAGASVLDGYRAQHILDGGDGQDYRPTSDHIDEAYAVRGQSMYKSGNLDGFIKNEADAAGARAQRRAVAVKDAMATGDRVNVLKTLNATVANGVKLTDIAPATAKDGKKTYKATYQLPDGSSRSEDVTDDEIDRRAGYVLSNPAEVAKTELSASLHRMESGLRVDEQNNAHTNRTAEQDQAHKDRLVEIGAHGSEARKTHASNLAEGGTIRPRDQIAAIDSERKDLRDQQTALFKDYTQQLKDPSLDDAQKGNLNSAYEAQVARLNEQLSDLGNRRKKVFAALNLSDDAGAATNLASGAKPSSKSAGKKAATQPTISNW